MKSFKKMKENMSNPFNLNNLKNQDMTIDSVSGKILIYNRTKR